MLQNAMRRILYLLPLLALQFACGEESEPAEITIEKTPKGGSSGSGGGNDSGGSGHGGSIQGGNGGSNAGQGGSTTAGKGGSEAGTGGSTTAGAGGDTAGAGGSTTAGAGGDVGEAGTGGNTTAGAGGSGAGQGGATAGSSGNNDAGTGGSTTTPASVAFVKPADGAKVKNPVAFSLKAEGVQSVGLMADDQYSIPLNWDPTSKPTYDTTYEFSKFGKRSLVLTGYVTGQATPAATASIQITVEEPPKSICDGASGLKFQPPKVCDKLGGNTTSEIPSNGYYSTSWFGCYYKSDGTLYKDPYDNCEFACGNKGLCKSGMSGPECEATLKWFAADADRYGCGARIRVTNCVNGKSVVLTTLDKGPNCKSVEQKYAAPVLDMSHDAMIYLFDGKTYGGSDKKAVIVEKVDASTPLGPIQLGHK